MKKIVLASSSPRRKEILEKLGINFEIVKSNYEENLDSLEFSYSKIEELALNKALDIVKKVENSIILAADTVVVLDNQILCKPINEDEAIKMLSMLSGKKHSVVTSICIIDSQTLRKKLLSETSVVEFKVLGEDLIRNYVKEYKPLDKAGSYGIQELPEGFVEKVEGSFENIMGLCPAVVSKILKEFE